MPEAMTAPITAHRCSGQIPMTRERDRHQGQASVEAPGGAETGLQCGCAEDGEQCDEHAPGAEHSAELEGREVHEEGGVAEDREEAPVVEQAGDAGGGQAAVPQRFEWFGERGSLRGPWCLGNQYHGRDERYQHQDCDAEERAAPADVAEQPAEQWAAGDAKAEGCLVEHDRAAESAAGRADDDRKGRRDEQGVAQPPAGAEPDDLPDAAAGTGDRGEHNDQYQAGDQCAFGADATGDPAGDQHRHRGDHQVAGEQQLNLDGVASSLDASEGRIGSTRPIPMNEMTQANATAQTAFGCRNGLADCAVGSLVCT